MRFLIVHGAYGRPDGNWFQWLKAELEMDGHEVFVPRFPTPDGQLFDAWSEIATTILSQFPAEDTVLIGHSVGAAFILRLAELSKQPYKAVFPICPFVCDLGLPEFDTLNSSFVHHQFSWDMVSKGAQNIICFASDNDPYVPLEFSKKISDSLNSEIVVVANGGHLNASSGYNEFPLLLNVIRQNS